MHHADPMNDITSRPGDAVASLRIAGLQVGRAEQLAWTGTFEWSAIRKQAVDGEVAVGPLGLAGDEQADRSVHGGLTKAVYAYPAAHTPFWQTVRAQAGAAGWGAPLPPGLLGENLTYEGPTEQALWIGDRFEFDDCVLAVSEPRLPCQKFGVAMGFAQAVKLMSQSGFCGAYLAVVQPGRLRAGQTGRLVAGPREVNLRELFLARMGRA